MGLMEKPVCAANGSLCQNSERPEETLEKSRMEKTGKGMKTDAWGFPFSSGKRRNGIVTALLLLTIFSLLLPIRSFAIGAAQTESSENGPGTNGWIQDPDGSWFYMDRGIPMKEQWIHHNDRYYYLGADGKMLTGWIELNGERFYLAENEVENHPLGSCYISERTPDGSLVDERGAYVVEKPPEPEPVPEPAPVPAMRPNPYGYSCVEVDISEQMMYCYIGSNLVLSSPCVTGRPGKRATSTGHWTINSKERNRYLQGYNENGTKYKSWVNYWMPFHNGQGLHDASWRSNFGGSIYKSSGSHGCVNLPPSVAASLYGIVWVGMPVNVHG